MKKIFTLRDYFQQRFGSRLWRIPLDPGFSCPNRRADGSGGCAFCPGDGARARHLKPGMPLEKQVAAGMEYVGTRYGAEPPYAAYFQAFTTTNTDAETLRSLYDRVLRLADFPCVIVATRPDALPEDVVDVLADLAREREVWVELGVQTANDATLRAVNRGHTFAAVQEAVPRLASRGVKVAAHVILGLPGETPDDYRETAEKLSLLPFSGIKVHNLLIYRGTPLEKLFRAGKLRAMNEYEYANVLADFLRLLPEGWVVMRLCADAPAEGLCAPDWWMEKGAFTDMFLRMFESGETSPDCMKAVRTGDGSYTFYHPKYRQHFHSVAGAREESFRKYLEPCRVRERLESGKSASILDVGFGMGCNVCAAVETAESLAAGTNKIHITTLELDRTAVDAALRLPERSGMEIIEALARTGEYESGRAEVKLILGDARESLGWISDRFDYIFLDAFTPEANPELWTLEFIGKLRARLKPDGLLASYCSAYPFRGALLKNQFHLYESKAFGRRRGGTVAALDSAPMLPPLARKELLITTESTAGTPYRDPRLDWTRVEILEQHARKIAELRAAGVPKWYREPKI